MCTWTFVCFCVCVCVRLLLCTCGPVCVLLFPGSKDKSPRSVFKATVFYRPTPTAPLKTTRRCPSVCRWIFQRRSLKSSTGAVKDLSPLGLANSDSPYVGRPGTSLYCGRIRRARHRCYWLLGFIVPPKESVILCRKVSPGKHHYSVSISRRAAISGPDHPTLTHRSVFLLHSSEDSRLQSRYLVVFQRPGS